MAISTRDAALDDGSEELVERIESLRAEVLRSADALAERLDALPPPRRPSAANLLHYLALRGHDLRPLQDRLARGGLDAFDHAEAHVLATLDAIRNPKEIESADLRSIVERIRPSVESFASREQVREAVRANVRASASRLRQGSPILARLIEEDGLLVVGAEYSLRDGGVEFFDGL